MGVGNESTLPTGGFKWEKKVERFTAKKIANLVKNGRKGYLLEVDVEYPIKLHDIHNDLPFMPEKMKINKVEKLVPNMSLQRKNMWYTFKALDQALKHGLVLKKVHRVISFQQSAWLKVYIDKNTQTEEKATKAKNNFEKDLFKLMNNQCMGRPWRASGNTKT